jgi:hypothetical protein
MLTAMHITGRYDIQGSTGDVLRLVGAGRARYLDQTYGIASPTLPREVAFDSVITLTSATTYQEIGELSLRDTDCRLPFVTIGSGYLVDGRKGRRRTAVSLSRCAPSDDGKEEITIISSCLVFDPLDRTCRITAIVFGALPDE